MSGERRVKQPGQAAADTNAHVQAWLAAIIESSDDAIVSKTLDGVVQSWNPGAERIFGYTADEMIGRPIAVLFPPDRLNEEPHILERIKRGEQVDHFETVRVRKDGRLIDVSVTISPVRGMNGNVIGASKIARDVTAFKQLLKHREQLLESEQAARREAERVSRVKDEFLATLGHELRTPLNAILGWTQLLRSQTTPSQADLTDALETIERNARIQTQLVEDLLDVSRVIAGTLRLDVQHVYLPKVIEEAIESVHPAAEAKGVRLIKVLDPHAGPVTGDASRLRQVCWNLLSNAVKFTSRGGKVQVVLRQVDSHLELTVSDTGQGIKAEFLPVIFQRFVQADGSTNRQHGGLGLGLAIVRHLAELHGGSVSASSPGEGQGATFAVKLPLALLREEHPDANPIRPIAADVSAPVQPYRLDLSGIKVLVVDDDDDARLLVKRILESNKAQVIAASTAAEGLEALRHARPHVAVIDIGMPGQDGYQMIETLRSFSAAEGGATPAVALTAFARSADRRRAMMAGFQTHLVKPMEPAELLMVIANLAGVGRRISHAEAKL